MRMLRYLVAGVVVAFAAIGAYSVLAAGSSHGARMTCSDAISESGAAEAARSYAATVEGQFGALHEFMGRSGFRLRNVSVEQGNAIFVYVIDNEFRAPCFWHRLLMIDDTLVAIGISPQWRVLTVE